MRLSSTLAAAAFGSLSYFPATYAWGAAGHQIVATIAQMYLHPTVLPTLCNILDLDSSSSNCHIATVSTWADQHRMQMRWSAALHYIGALDDHPSQSCAFPGSRGWAGSPGGNVLDAIKNTTHLLQDWVQHDASDVVANEALKFLIHFVGDMHQPLHLTGRDRGGNSVKVTFGRRHTNLHSLWDTFLIAKAVRLTPRNYTHPLPYPQVENALRGTIYDSYIRRILWEGILNPWADDLPSWLTCPAPSSSSSSSSLNQPHPAPASGLLGIWQTAYSLTNKLIQTLTLTGDGVEISPDDQDVCPYFWAQPLHKLNCDIVWPKELDEASFKFNVRSTTSSDARECHGHCHGDVEEDEDDSITAANANTPLLDLDTPEYAGVIEKDMIIEKLLAQGGIRLAGVLNYIFADEGQLKEGQRKLFLEPFREI